jgi:iron complex outermembrane receptor protein
MKLRYLMASAAVLPAMTIGMPAFAQSASDEGASGIEEIIVTARKTSESLQTTPVAVSAISGEALADQQIVGIQQLQATTPNLTFSSAVAQPGSSTVFIRGQGSSDGLIAIDQAVGVYVDGVYAARSTGGATDLFDVERVEVLRGPQGTLFGRNTTGGAINIIANKPSDEFEGSMRFDYGNYDTRLAQGVLNVPFGSGVAFRAAYQHREHGGYGRTVTLNRPLGDLKSDYARFTFGIEPEGSKFSALISGDFSKFSNSGELIGLKSYSAPNAFAPTELLAAACGTQAIPAGLPAATAGFLGGLKAGAIPLCPTLATRPGPISTYVYGQNGNTNIYRTFGNTPSYGKSDSYGASSVLQYEFSDAAVLKSTTAWRGVELESRTDNDGTPYTLTGGLVEIPGRYAGRPGNAIEQDQFSQELQLSGDIGQVQYILGGFYFVENGTDRSDSGSLFPLSPSVATVDGIVRNKSLAGYGQIIFNVTESVRVTGGLRYTKDDRSLVIRNRDTNLLTGAVTSSLGTVADGLLDGDTSDPFRASFQRSYNYWSYLVSVDWQANDDVFLYAKTSRSQRSGGLNTRAVFGVGGLPVSFAPEVVSDYEVGAKVDFFDRRVRLNLAVFNSDVDNVQRNLAGAVGTRLVGGAANAAKARIRGLEAELTVAPTDGLTLGANLGYTDAMYKRFINVDGADFSGGKFPYTPEVTLGVFGDYSMDVGAGTIKLHADYSWRSETYHTALAASTGQRVGRTQAEIDVISRNLQNTAKLPSYGLLNARIAFQLDDPNLEFALYARNIAKEKYFTRYLAVENTPLAFTSYMPGDPRTYGASVTFRF